MMITVENRPLALLELLWVREVWDLDIDGDVPPHLEDPPGRLGPSEAVDEWARTWPQLWRECLDHLAVDTGPILRRLPSTADGSAERAELLGALLGPSWRRRIGEESLGASFAAWQEARHPAPEETIREPLDATPERRALGALVPAWEAGLTKVVTLPCRGEYTRVVAGSALVITEREHRDAGRYSAALSSFATGTLR